MRNHKSGSLKLFAAGAALAWALFAAPSFAQVPMSDTRAEPAPAAPATETIPTPGPVVSVGSSQNLGWYFGVQGGYNSLSDSHDETSNAAAAAQLDLLGIGLIGNGGGLLNTGTSLDSLCQLNLLNLPLSALLCPGATTPGASTSTTSSYKGGMAVGLNLGYSFDNGLRPEINASYRKNDYDTVSIDATGATTASDGSRQSISVMGNLWYDFLDRSNKLRPYIGVGVGANNVKLSGAGTSESKTALGYQGGAGVSYAITPASALSLDYRYFVTNDLKLDSGVKTDYKANTILLGYRVYFGNGNSKCPNAPEGVALGSDGCPLDSDGDGIPDYMDKCPGTPAGAKVDANGCELDSDGDGVPDSRDQCPGTPAGVSVDEKGCPLDSDGDGVPDYLDKCPNTPAGTLVDANGCPAADSDGDGIPDYLDKCPNTPKGVVVDKNGCPLDSDGDGIPDYLDECPHSPAGAKVLPNGCAPVGDCRRPRPGEEVDANGCAVEQKFILRGVKFEFDSDRLTPEAKIILDSVAVTLNNYAEIKVELAGHTDNIGSDAYNLGLSERRSISVKNYLTGKGVTASRMTPVGYGLTQPIASNDSEEGREENRRVELKVIE